MLEPIRPRPIIPSCMAASRLKHEDVNGDGQTNHRQDSRNNQRRPDMQLYNRLGDRSILHIHPSTQYGRTVLRVSSVPDLSTVAWPCSADENWSKTIPTLERE